MVKYSQLNLFSILLLWLEEHSMMNILIVNGPRSYSIEAVSIFSQHSCSDKISPQNLPVKDGAHYCCCAHFLRIPR